MSKLSKILNKDLFELISLFNGFDTLKKIVNLDPDAKNKLEKKLKGSYRFMDENKKIHIFNFLITDISIESYDGDTYIYLGVNLLVPGLDTKYYETVAKWVDSYAEDMNGDIDVPSIYRGYKHIRIKYVNGVEVDMPHTHFGENQNLIPDIEIYSILPGINEEVVRIKKLFI
jgi:hypothetical protein